MKWLGKLLNKIHAPGLVRPMRDYYNGILVEVSNSDYYTKISVNGREYFFNRESGKYDGFGRTVEEVNETLP